MAEQPGKPKITNKKNMVVDSTVRIHESHASIPQLASAPPSGNLNPASSDPLSNPLSLTLPPPPPPPPPRGSSSFNDFMPTRVNLTGGTVRTTSTSSFSLPPPPQVSPVPTQTVAELNVGATPAIGISMFPPPPPPPPPPPRVTVANLPPPPPHPPAPPASMADDATPPMQNTKHDGVVVVVSDEATTLPPIEVTVTAGPPPFVPLTTFAPKKSQLLARRQTHVPVLVIATEAANQLAWKNDLQLVDLFQGIVADLRPSSSSTTPFRSINRSIFPTNVRMQFVEPIQMEPLSNDQALGLLSDDARIQERDGNVAKELVLLEDRVDELLQERTKDESLQQASKDAFQLTSPTDIPWLIRYRNALDATTNSLPHDLINCPPLILLVCTTNEIEAPEQVLQQLYNSLEYVYPSAFKTGLYDPRSMRHEVLVLHDAVDGPANVNDNLLRQSIQSNFGPGAAVLRINSVLPETAKILMDQEDSDLWGGDGKKGNYLSQNDRVILRRYFQTLLSASLLPALERRIADLNTIVSERKKGVRNLVKSFWRQPKEKGGSGGGMDSAGPQRDDDSMVKYRYDSIESQTRLLADTLFLIQDYEAALSIYRLIRDDYKSDKALAYYGSVQEMMALCMFQLDPYTRSKDIFSHLETALLSYTRAAEEERNSMSQELSFSRPTSASHSTRLATRLCLLFAAPSSKSLTKGREVEVADLLASASSHESSLGAAVLLEQSSAFYYAAGMHRKYAFHMLMSGHMFRTAGQDHHAFRCFTSALYIYRHGGWHELHNHLRSALAAQLYTMERFSIALILYAKLVGIASGGKVSAKSQAKFLQHLIDICTNHTKSALAGADRMASPPTIPSKEREAFRNAQLGKIVGVIRYTMGTSRVLELPYVDLPRISDSSVRIWTHAEQHFDAKGGEPGLSALDELGMPAQGHEQVWNDLELTALAELNAVDKSRPQLDENMTAALAKIPDHSHRRVIAEIDKERQVRNLVERSKRKGSMKPTPSVRARSEPIFCDFLMQNTLSVDIEVTGVQLVVALEDTQGRTCTNEFAIQFRDGKNRNKGTQKGEWIFPSTDKLRFCVPDFCRISEMDSNACKPATSDPFFVVTKETVALPAGEERTVSAGLTPLVEGRLQILGVRFKLSDQVWIYHPFYIPGPLLKDTRTNIMNRVRGESILLKSRIECDMPCLSAELVKSGVQDDSPGVATDGGPLLEGQISNWTIRLRNVGTAPASRIMLKTNLPWVNLVESKSEMTTLEKESRATSFCLGPSGTMMTLPIERDSLQLTGTIQPGESVDVSVQIRISGNKRQDFYMLYRYELSGNKARSRWLRKMFTVPVYPSLILSANTLTSSWNGRESLLAVELTNNRTDRPTDLFITLDHLSLVSRHYRLEALPGQFVTNEQFGNVLQIGWQERITVHYRVCALPTESKSCLLNECAFTEKAECSSNECANYGATDYLCLEQANESFQSAWNTHQVELLRIENLSESEKEHPRSIASIRRANTSAIDDDSESGGDGGETGVVEHPTSIAKLFPPHLNSSKVHVICSWRAILGQQVVHGENYICNVPVRPLNAKQFLGNPLVTTAIHPSTVSHNFSAGKPATVPLRVSIRNILETCVEFYVLVLPTAGFELIGSHMQRFKLVASGEVDLSFEALVPMTGIHDMQSLQLTIHHEMGERTYNLSEQWLVRVTNTAA